MTVKELRELLLQAPDDLEVIISKDAEGNLFKPVAELGFGTYQPATTWYGDFETSHVKEEWTAICIWPVN